MNITYSILPIQYSYIFCEPTKPVTEYLKLVPREIAVQYALLIANYSEDTDWKTQLNSLSFDSLVKWVCKVKMAPHESEFPEAKYVLFTPLTGLELLKQIFTISAYEHHYIGYEWQCNLIKAITIVNTNLLEEGPKYNDSSFERFQKSLKHFRYELDDRIFFYAAIYRAMCLLDFLENGNSIISIELRTELTQRLNSSSIREYIKEKLYLLRNLDVKPKNKYQILRYKSDYQKMETNAISYNEEIKIDKNKDYTEFKRRPFIQIQKGKFSVVRNTFVANLIYNKLKFTLLDCYKDVVNGNAQEFFGEFNKDFVEKVLFVQLFKYSFNSSKYICFSENECIQRISEYKVHNPGALRKDCTQSLMDGYVRCRNKILLIECKGKIISLNALYNETQLRKDIDHDIVGQEGTGQLIRNCERIFRDGCIWDNHIPTDYVIYPLLVLDDIGFSADGFNQYVIESTTQFVNEHKKSVYPFTTLDIETFILISDLIGNNQLDIFKVIEGYHTHICKSEFEEREISFATYLRSNYETKSPKVVLNWLSQLFQ